MNQETLTRAFKRNSLAVVAAGAILLAASADAAQALERRVAFVVGNSAYANVPTLPNPKNDAEAVAQSLRDAGFDVITALDLDHQQFDTEFQKFVRSLAGADISMFYYSGHGIQVGGDNRIIPVDANLKTALDMEVETISLRTIMGYMQANSKSQLVYLDSCRNNPFPSSSFLVGPDKEVALTGEGLAAQEASRGSLIAFSTQPGNVAVDGFGTKSPFTEAVLSRSFNLGVDVQSALMKVTQDVWETTKQKQRPWSSSTLVEPIFLAQPTILIAMEDEPAQTTEQPSVVISSNDAEPQADAPVDAAVPSTATQLASLIGEAFEKVPRIPIGVGAVAMLGNLPILRGQSGASIEISQTPNRGVLYLDDKALLKGSVIDQASLAKVRYEPSVGSEGQTESLELKIAQASGEQAVVQGKIEPYLEDCDKLAGEPLDLQGVSPGLLPNEIDPLKAVPACTQATAAFPDVARYTYQLGRANLAARDLPAAKMHFEQAVKLGHIRAYYQLGNMAGRGFGRPQDLAEANRLLKFGAEQGDPFAMVSYGRNLLRGRGITKDIAAGTAFLNKAVEMGHTFAMNELGSMYYYGRGVKLNAKRGVRFYEAALARNDIYAMNNIAFAYAHGKGVKKDQGTALALFKKASEGGHPSAPTNIGIMYLNGEGVKKDTVKAVQWYELGAERGDSYAAANLAWIYVNGPGALRDPAKAAWFSSMSKALDPFGENPKAGAELKKLPASAKAKAIKAMTGELGAEGLETSADLDGTLVLLARKVWQKRNPRYDLF